MLQIIANETSGNGSCARALKDVEKLLDDLGLDYQLNITEYPGHASLLADEAIRRGETEFVCIGGDGTISEVVNGFAGRLVTLYLVPCGTGNDFVRCLDLPKDPVLALKAQLSGKPYLIDVGRVNDHFFLNISGGGFDTEVLNQAAHFKKLGKGILPYLLGIFAALFRFRPLPVEMTMNGKTVKKEVTIFSVGNGRYFGGGMMAVPHAELDDGLFDVVIADKLGRLSILRLLSKFISGKHTSLPVVHESRCRELTVRCPGMIINIDGELFKEDTARYQIFPSSLRLMLPDRE